MANKTTVRSSGVSFLGLLAILFIGLKLGAVIDWSWWWVTAPIWIMIFVALFAFAFIVVVGKNNTHRWRM